MFKLNCFHKFTLNENDNYMDMNALHNYIIITIIIYFLKDLI